MGSSKDDARHGFVSEHAITFDLSSVSTEELRAELERRFRRQERELQAKHDAEMSE